MLQSGSFTGFTDTLRDSGIVWIQFNEPEKLWRYECPEEARFD